MRKQKVVAIIYDKQGNILSRGRNSYTKTHPLQARHAAKVGLHRKIYLHAEIDALRRCKDLTKAYRMKVVRKLPSGRTGSAKPCPICQSAIDSIPSLKIVEHT